MILNFCKNIYNLFNKQTIFFIYFLDIIFIFGIFEVQKSNWMTKLHTYPMFRVFIKFVEVNNKFCNLCSSIRRSDERVFE
jgi:hypothetical protein